jgi:hypothetical protein
MIAHGSDPVNKLQQIPSWHVLNYIRCPYSCNGKRIPLLLAHDTTHPLTVTDDMDAMLLGFNNVK